MELDAVSGAVDGVLGAQKDLVGAVAGGEIDVRRGTVALLVGGFDL